MICQRCLFSASRTVIRATSSSSRSFSKTSLPRAQAVSSTQNSTPQPPEAAISNPSVTQPLTASSTKPNPEHSANAPVSQPIRSSVSAGTVLKGLNYHKNKTDPVALEDHEYPEWLWHVLDEKPKSAAEGQKVEQDPRLYAKSARARQKANKAARLAEKRNPPPSERQIPIYQQSIDLPAGKDVKVEVAQAGRQDLTKAMRNKRRRDIKEGNFLKSMT